MNVSSVNQGLFPTAQDGFTTTLSSATTPGATTVYLVSTGNYNTGDVVVLTVDYGTSNEAVFTGTLNTSTKAVTGVVWTEGNTGAGHSVGATVVDNVAATHLGLLEKGLTVDHDPVHGGHKSLHDVNGNIWIQQIATSSATNYMTLTNTTGSSPILLGTNSSSVGLQINNQIIPYKFAVYSTVGQTLSANTNTVVQWNQKLYDTGNNFNTSTYQYITPVAGYWWLSFSVQIGVSGISTAASAVAWMVSGSTLIQGQQIVGSGNTYTLPQSQASGIFYLAANSQIQIDALCSEGGRSINTNSYATYFQGCYLSAL